MYLGLSVLHKVAHISLRIPHAVDLPTWRLKDRDTCTSKEVTFIKEQYTYMFRTAVTCEFPVARYLKVNAKRSAGEIVVLSAL